jgi:hypothetical protein
MRRFLGGHASIIAISGDFAGGTATIKLLPQKLEKWVPYGCFIQESPADGWALQSKRKGGSIL